MTNKENVDLLNTEDINNSEDIDSTFDIAEDNTKEKIMPQSFFVSEISKEFHRFNKIIGKTKRFEIKKNIFTSSIDIILRDNSSNKESKLTIQYAKYLISSISLKEGDNNIKSIYYIPLTSVTYKEGDDVELKLLSVDEINVKIDSIFREWLDKSYNIAIEERTK